jgi:hypothetical protein
MTFVVPVDDRDNQTVVIAGATGGNTATNHFNVLPSLSVTPIYGSMGDAGVTVAGSGYTATDTITGFTVGGITPATTTIIPGPVVVGGNGAWGGTFTVPQVPIAGADQIIASTADDSASVTFTIADWISLDIGKVLSECSDEYGIPIVTVDPVLGIVTFDRSEGAAVTKTERHTSKSDPRTVGDGSNQWES